MTSLYTNNHGKNPSNISGVRDNPLLHPDVNEALSYLAVLDPTLNPKFVFTTFDDHGDDRRLATRLYGDLYNAVRLTGPRKGQTISPIKMLTYMQSLQAGAFVQVQRSDGNGSTASHIIGPRALIADADSDAQLETLHHFTNTTGLDPSIIVSSGGITATGADKLQAYWPVDGCPVAEYVRAQCLLSSRTGTDPAVNDLARVLRLPGFFHQKREPRQTRILSLSGRRYSYADLLKRVERAAAVCEPRIAQHGAGKRLLRGNQQQLDGSEPTARLRVLLARHGGLITPSVDALLREARSPTDGSPGNRHYTLVAIAARCVQLGWPDVDIRELVLPAAIPLWDIEPQGLADHLDEILRWVRRREAVEAPEEPASSRAAQLAAAFGSRREGTR